MDKAHGFLKVIVTFVTLFVPCILLAGYVYYLGYSLTFGLSPDLIGKSLADMLVESWYLGVMIIAWLLPKWWYLIVLAILLILFSVGILLYWHRLEKPGETLFSEKITKENQGRELWGLTQWHRRCLWETVEELSSLLVVSMLVLFFGIALIILPYQHGNTEALKHIAEHQRYGCEAKEEMDGVARCNYLIDTSGQQEKIIAQGILVAANNSRIALFDNNKFEVWPLLDNYIIRKQYFTKQSTSEKTNH